MKQGKDEPQLFVMIPNGTIVKPGAFRAFSGEAMEEAIVSLFSLLPGIPNGSAKLCTDAFSPEGRRQPIEIKSLKFHNKLPLYKFRLEKDDPDTLYFIGVHKRKTTRDIEVMWKDLSKTLKRVFIVPHSAIMEVIPHLKLHKIKTEVATESGKRNGYQREGYRDGYYNIPYGWLRDQLTALPFLVSSTVHGLPFSVKVLIHHSLCPSPNTPKPSRKARPASSIPLAAPTCKTIIQSRKHVPAASRTSPSVHPRKKTSSSLKTKRARG